jgi:hypothetical protein
MTPFFSNAIAIDNPLSASTFEEFIQDIIDLIFWIGIIITPLMILIGGFYFLTSAGNPQRVQTAKKVIFWTIVGLLIVLLAKGVISMLRQILEG